MKETIEKIKDSGWFTRFIILWIPFFIWLLWFNEIVYIVFVAILTFVLIILWFLEEKTFWNFITSIFMLPFIWFAIWALLAIPAWIWQLIWWSISSGALIKWNISYETHEKIYHIPWCKHYEDTVIDTSEWEKWFKTEKEAKEAWWRKCRTEDSYY